MVERIKCILGICHPWSSPSLPVSLGPDRSQFKCCLLRKLFHELPEVGPASTPPLVPTPTLLASYQSP